MQVNTSYQYQTNFTGRGKHLPRTFSSMMNYLYQNTQKECRDVFQCADTIAVSTTLKNGLSASGVVNFSNGKYAGLVMDEGSEGFKQEFIRTIMEKYKKQVAKGNTRRKLGYDA